MGITIDTERQQMYWTQKGPENGALEQATKPLCAGRGVEHWHLTAHAFGGRTHRQYSAEEKMLSSWKRLRGRGEYL
ncbi:MULTISPECIES: hypothetical protein [unclassified Bradyrhizobium]|uniref:hypothetical protein n=1 Tax=unclassified Bradyrhizobium TaxID=2631580 RepID=UPI001FF7B093|nr:MULTISPECIES: hypothetical protein [unclassified Bradyrhizobium]